LQRLMKQNDDAPSIIRRHFVGLARVRAPKTNGTSSLSRPTGRLACRISLPLSIHSTGHCETRGPVLSMQDSTNSRNRSTFHFRHPMLRRTLLTIFGFTSASVLTTALVAQAPSPAPPAGFFAIFNGQDLSGWKGLAGDPKKRAKMSAE